MLLYRERRSHNKAKACALKPNSGPATVGFPHPNAYSHSELPNIEASARERAQYELNVAGTSDYELR